MLTTWLTTKALAIVLAAIPVGIIASLVFQFVKRQRAAVDALPPYVKNGVVFAIGAVVAAVSAFTNVPVDCVAGENCLALLDEPTIAAMLKAVLSFGAAKLTHLIVKHRA